ncbi:MAG: hypothetical protein Q9162_007581 [Coniocarpon cinnabarinum]
MALQPFQRPLHPPRLARIAQLSIRNASNATPQTDKSRILEKPSRFNPPSHGARRVKPRMYPGPKLTAEEEQTQSTRRYPNMMPPEGTFMHWFLTGRSLHVWITLGVLTSLAIYSITLSFLNHTAFRDQLPSKQDWTAHPYQSLKQWIHVYRLHVAHESELVADKRRKKLEDAEKRREFMRAHGVEPGFLTGSWMEKFGTVEGDQAREAMQRQMEEERTREGRSVDEQSPVAVDGHGETQPRMERPKRKVWLGIW